MGKDGGHGEEEEWCDGGRVEEGCGGGGGGSGGGGECVGGWVEGVVEMEEV